MQYTYVLLRKRDGRFAPALAASCFLLACGHRQAPPPAPQGRGVVMFGRWEYVAPAKPPARAPTLGAGLLVALEIDSAQGPLFYGRVARWFAGDAGTPPSAFGPVTGTVSEQWVQLAISFTRTGASQITVGARLAGADTLAIETATRGNDPGPFAQGPGAIFVRTRKGPATSKP